MCSSEAWLILIAFHGPCPRSPSITTQLWVPFNKGSTKAKGELLVFASEIGSLIFPASRCFLVSLLDANWCPDSSATPVLLSQQDARAALLHWPRSGWWLLFRLSPLWYHIDTLTQWLMPAKKFFLRSTASSRLLCSWAKSVFWTSSLRWILGKESLTVVGVLLS